MGVELILNSANINLVAFSKYSAGNISGQIFAIFIIVVAAAEAAVGLALIVVLSRQKQTLDVDQVNEMKG